MQNIPGSNTSAQPKPVSPKAVISVIFAFMFLSLVGVLVKIQGRAGAPVAWTLFMQFATGLLIVTVIAAKSKFVPLKTSHFGLLAVRSLGGLFAFLCYATAISKIPLVNATLLNNTTPLFIPAISFIWLHDRIDKKIWWGILAGLAGIILILHPGAKDLIKSGDLFGLLSGLFLAIAYVALKVLTKTESFITVLFYYSLISAVCCVPFAQLGSYSPSREVLIASVATGICFSGYMFMIQYAYEHGDASRLAPFNYMMVVFTGLFDWLIYNEVPGILSLIGIILVSAGGIISISVHEKGNRHLKHSVHG